MNNYKDLLKEALSDIKDEELENLPAEDEIDYEFSDDFNRWSKKLINKQKAGTSKTFQKIIAALLALFFAFMLVKDTNAVRNIINELTYRFYRDDVIEFNIDGTDEIVPGEYVAYELPVLPQGYEFFSIQPEDGHTRRWYKNPHTGQEIAFEQISLNSNVDSLNRISTNGGYVEYLSVNFEEVIYIDSKNTCHVYWKELGCIFYLSYPSEIGKDYLNDVVCKLIIEEDYLIKDEIF